MENEQALVENLSAKALFWRGEGRWGDVAENVGDEITAEYARAANATALVLDKAAATITAQRERIAALEGALEPFGQLELREHVSNDALIETIAFTAGEHRAARAALNGGDHV